MTRNRLHVVLWSTLVVATVLLSGCDGLLEGDAELRDAVREALPAIESFELVEIDDRPILEALADLASGGDGSTPIYVQLPVVDADGTVIEDFSWTVYPHDLRRFDPERGGTPV